MIHRIVFSRAAAQDIRRVRDRGTLTRLMQAIESLAADPRPPGARKLKSVSDIWRIRSGKWRVCYTIEADELVILVLAVGQRGNVYERLRQRLD